MKYNALYDHGRNLFALGGIQWKPNGSDIRAILVDPFEYTPDFKEHKDITSIPDNAIHYSNKHPDLDSMPQLPLITPKGGICDASDIKFTGITKGKKIGYLVLYLNNETRDLICCCNIGAKDDYFKSTGRPIIIGWSNSENRIFKL